MVDDINSNSSSIPNSQVNNTFSNSPQIKKSSIGKFLIYLITFLFILIIGYFIFLRLSSIIYLNNDNMDITKGLTIEKCMENDQLKGCNEFFYKLEIADECSKLNQEMKDECLKKSAMISFRPELCEPISNEELKTNCKNDVLLIPERIEQANI
ncbi:MAG: hypothetical protein WC867_04130 [Candidatus Pacearchaeota archaeon]|jgi:small-conductance mechanosensitive channel